jgi:outer membrane lipoprotein-sorting protein
MRRMFAVFAVLLLAGAVGFAQQKQASPAGSQPAAGASQQETLSGKLLKVVFGDTQKKTHTEIQVLKGEKSYTIWITSATRIIDKAGKALALKNLVKDRNVTVRYTTDTKGDLIATRIQQV